MMNQFILVGRVYDDFKKGHVGSKEVMKITLAVPRSYKNENGEYDTDFIPVLLRGNIAESTMQYCKKGDVIGIRGVVETLSNNGKTSVYIFADKVTFLSSKPREEEDEDDE